MILSEQVYPIGKLTRTHGKTGELQCLTINTAWEDADAQFIILQLDNILTPFRVLDWRTKGADSLLLRLSGINDETSAQRLVGAEAFMLRKDLTQTDPDELRWTDLVGYTLIDKTLGLIGQIQDVDDSTANILLAVKREGNNQPLLIPLHEDFIDSFSQTDKQIYVDLPFQIN